MLGNDYMIDYNRIVCLFIIEIEYIIKIELPVNSFAIHYIYTPSKLFWYKVTWFNVLKKNAKLDNNYYIKHIIINNINDTETEESMRYNSTYSCSYE